MNEVPELFVTNLQCLHKLKEESGNNFSPKLFPNAFGVLIYFEYLKKVIWYMP